MSQTYIINTIIKLTLANNHAVIDPLQVINDAGYTDFMWDDTNEKFSTFNVFGVSLIKDIDYKNDIIECVDLKVNSKQISTDIFKDPTAEFNFIKENNLAPLYFLYLGETRYAENIEFDAEIVINGGCIGDIDNDVIFRIKLLISVDNSICNDMPLYNKLAEMISSNMESFMLIRTNPKLTGNVKLVVTEDYNVYLDTFKVTANLNEHRYRKVPASLDGDYPHDIYKAFKNLPTDDMFSVYKDSYDPHKNYYKMEEQIENVYEYGAEYNDDNLYSENMRILAPLYIGKHVPQYFAIFRTDKMLTTDYSISNAETFKSLLKDALAVKIFDLRNSTPIGKYLNNYQKQITNYLAGTCALQFIKQDATSSDTVRFGKNTWKGIAVDKGILTDKTETSYFADKILEGAYPQEKYNMFLVNGYERNNLIFPNIINLQFMFNDPDAEEFSMHNYFGLYLTENSFATFNQIAEAYLLINSTDRTSEYNVITEYYDENNEKVSLSNLHINVIDNINYKDRIFFTSTINNVAHTKSTNDFYKFINSYVKNKPYKNYVQYSCKNITAEDTEKNFITLHFTELIQDGEHFKFVALNHFNELNKKENIVLEIIASSDSRLANYYKCVNPYIATNTPELLKDDKTDSYTKLYRLTFYAMDLADNAKYAPLEEQLDRIQYCISKFDSFIKVSSISADSLGIISSYGSTYFQHILNENVSKDKEYIDPVRSFNKNNIVKCNILKTTPDIYRDDDRAFANTGFELFGDRYSNIVKFIEFFGYKRYVMYEIAKDVYEDLKDVPYPIISTVKGYYPIIKSAVNEAYIRYDNATNSANSTNLIMNTEYYTSIISPWNVEHSIVVSLYDIITNNDMMNICSPIATNVSLMGINAIKDIDMCIGYSNVNRYKLDTTTTFKAGESVLLDGSDSRLKLYTLYKFISGSTQGLPIGSDTTFIITADKIYYMNNSELISQDNVANSIVFDNDSIIQLINNNLDLYDYLVGNPIISEESFYNDPNDTLNSNLTTPLIPAVSCGWKSNGSYFDKVNVLNTDQIVMPYQVRGNFINNSYNPNGSITNEHVNNNINDAILYDDETIITIKDMICSNKYKNYIKKYLISNYKLDTAIGYYNPYVQTLSFIYYGILFTYKLSNNKYANEIKLNEFNNYEIYIINNYNDSKYNEMFVNKNDEFILIINHSYKAGSNYDADNFILPSVDKLINSKYSAYDAEYTYNMINTAFMTDEPDTTPLVGKYFLNKTSANLLNLTNVEYIIQHDSPKGGINYNEQPKYEYWPIIDIDEDNEPFNAFETLPNYDSIYSDSFYSEELLDETIEHNDKYIFNNNINNLPDLYKFDGDNLLKHTYLVKYSSESDNISYLDKINNFINSFNNNLMLYVISSDKCKIYDINDSYKPIIVTLSVPELIKYNLGLFDPNFIDIVDFSINDSISKDLNLDTLYANTLVSEVKCIKNYYQYKIFDYNKYGNYNYFVESDRSLVSTCWDNNIYRLYENDDDYDYVYGFSTGIIDKMFFGSSCLNIKSNYIKLNKWNYNYDKEVINYANIITGKYGQATNATENYLITLNLTKTFYDAMINNESFSNNWNNITDQINKKVYINNYINNTFIKLYNFNSNFEVELYYKYDSTLQDSTEFIMDALTNSELNGYKLVNNFETDFTEVNNEIILTITTNNYKNYKFYPTVKISKK